MEASSLFEDLVFSLEIAGHDAGMQHYGARMLLDTASLRREYREWFVPEDWSQPFLVRAEVMFEMDALTEARAQFTPDEIAEAFGLLLPDDEDDLPPLQFDVNVRFTLDLYNWEHDRTDLERWHAYLASISARDKLEAGVRNLRGEVRRALQAAAPASSEWSPELTITADQHLVPEHGLVAKTLVVEWSTGFDAESEEDDFDEQLDVLMTCVRAGLEATRTFQQEIQRDYEEMMR